MKTSPLLSIFLIVLVDVLGLTIILPLLPFYAESFGATPAVVGMLVSAYAICQLIAGPNFVRYSSAMCTSSAATVRRNNGRITDGSLGRFK